MPALWRSRRCSRTSTQSFRCSIRWRRRRSGRRRSRCASRRSRIRGRSAGCPRWACSVSEPPEHPPMGFFAEFNSWLNTVLTGYIGDHTARIAAALEPAIITLGVVYVMIWGYLQLTGQIEEPFLSGVKRIITLAVILGCALHLWLYNALLVNTFFNAPSERSEEHTSELQSLTNLVC